MKKLLLKKIMLKTVLGLVIYSLLALISSFFGYLGQFLTFIIYLSVFSIILTEVRKAKRMENKIEKILTLTLCVGVGIFLASFLIEDCSILQFQARLLFFVLCNAAALYITKGVLKIRKNTVQ